MADTVAQAEEALQFCQNLYDQADSSYRAASRERTEALNALNAAQKKFDEAVGEVRKKAPRDSDWKSVMGLPA